MGEPSERIMGRRLGVVVDGCSFDIRLFHPLPSPVSRRTERVRSRFLPPLQSVLSQTFSAAVTGAERRKLCGLSRAHLGGAGAEREPVLLSGERPFSRP